MKLKNLALIFIVTTALILVAVYFFYAKSNSHIISANNIVVKLPDKRVSEATGPANSVAKEAISKSIETAKQAAFNTLAAKRLL